MPTSVQPPLAGRRPGVQIVGVYLVSGLVRSCLSTWSLFQKWVIAGVDVSPTADQPRRLGFDSPSSRVLNPWLLFLVHHFLVELLLASIFASGKWEHRSHPPPRVHRWGARQRRLCPRRRRKRGVATKPSTWPPISLNTTLSLFPPWRFFKLHERKCEPIIMTVPRKVSAQFLRQIRV